MITHIALLDLDGVLVQPGGYRAAFIETMKYFLRQIGLESLIPGSDVPSKFEAIGITNEWDMVPICIALALESSKVCLPGDVTLDDWSHVVDMYGPDRKTGISIDYPGMICSLAPLLRPGLGPTEAIADSQSDAANGSVFPWLSGQPILNYLLCDTRDVSRSITTQVFQNMVLGDRKYYETYREEAFICTGSLLEKHDRTLLDADILRYLFQLEDAGTLYPCIFSARPSLPPMDVDHDIYGFSPEAEAAVALSGLERIPLIASGRLKYYAELKNLSFDQLVKPAPFQALAAIFAAWNKKEFEPLLWAGEIYRRSQDGTLGEINKTEAYRKMQLPRNTIVHIFEDSFVGIKAGTSAVELLKSIGVNIHVRAWGIAREKEKTKALMAVGAQVFNNVNLAMQSAFVEMDK
jgi:hypothetical protein